MSDLTNTKYRRFSFDQEGAEKIKLSVDKGQNWPVVYILNGDKEAYVGETNNAYKRMGQHLENQKRSVMTHILLLLNDSFNKSATLDIENKLIQFMHADGKFELQNENAGQSVQHNYYQRGLYERCFQDIWDELKRKKLANKTLYEIKNSEIFKYSPYKELTEDQFSCVERLLAVTGKSLEQNLSYKMVIQGGAGTGKTVLAVYFIKCLMDILSRNTNFEDLDEVLPEDSPILQSAQLVKVIQERKDLKVAFVVPTPSFRETVKKIFKVTKGLKPSMVIGPNDIAKKDYDIVIVDEAHRLQRRKDLVNYGAYDAVCDSLGLSHDATQLDWIMARKRPLTVIFYDAKQRVKNTDMLEDSFNDFINGAEVINLSTQLRIQGGNEYIQFINDLLNNKKVTYESNKYDLFVFDDYGEMEQAIKSQNKKNEGLCRIVAGISYPYSTKMRDKVAKKKLDVDVNGDGKYLRMWNLGFNDPTFITDEAHKDEIGCVYTCQGYDLNYVGVILGPDIFYNKETKKIDIHIEKCTDKKTKVKDNDEETKINILHQYLVLLTRGIYGTYIYAVDKDLKDYLTECILTKKESIN